MSLYLRDIHAYFARETAHGRGRWHAFAGADGCEVWGIAGAGGDGKRFGLGWAGAGAGSAPQAPPVFRQPALQRPWQMRPSRWSVRAVLRPRCRLP